VEPHKTGISTDVSIDGSDGVVIKSFHGAVIAWDGSKIRHCSSIKKPGNDNKCLWVTCLVAAAERRIISLDLHRVISTGWKVGSYLGVTDKGDGTSRADSTNCLDLGAVSV
jgi:hypothetical protein